MTEPGAEDSDVLCTICGQPVSQDLADMGEHRHPHCMTMPNDQEAAGLRRDFIAGCQAMRRGDTKTADVLLSDEGLMLGMAIAFLWHALQDGGQDVDAWLAAKLEKFRDV